MSLAEEKLEGLCAMDDPGNMTILQEIGVKAAGQRVRAADFPPAFDLGE